MNIEKCYNCGLCKSVCPVFKVLLKETVSPRGKLILIKNDLVSTAYYLCTLCGKCKEICPIQCDIPRAIRLIRNKLIDKGIETKPNKEIIKNLNQYGNPFEKKEKKDVK